MIFTKPPIASHNPLNDIDFLNPCQMPSTLKWSVQPHPNNLKSLFLGDRTLAQRQTIAVIMGSVPNGDLFIPTKPASHSANSVRDDGLPIARSTQHDTSFHFATGDRFGDWADEIGIVAWSVRFGAAIAHRMSIREEHGFDFFFISETRVIGPDGDGESFHEM